MERTLEADKGFAVKRVSRSAFPLAYKYGWTLSQLMILKHRACAVL